MHIAIKVSAFKKRLRKQQVARASRTITPENGERAAVEVGHASHVTDIGPDDIVRVGYSISRIHADQIEDILSKVLQATGRPCSASDIVRVAINELHLRPLSAVLPLLENLKRHRPGRRPRAK